MKLEYCLKNENFKYRNDTEVEFIQDPLVFVLGKRDWAAFQIVLKGHEDFTVSAGGNPVFTPRGTLPNVRLQCSMEMLGVVTRMFPVGMVEDDDGVCKADMLLHNETVHVEKLRIQPVWVEAVIPEYAHPGTYTGRLDIFTHAMFENEKKIGTL